MIAPLLALLLATASAAGQFTIAGERFAAADILDARAMPDISGATAVMISLSPAATKRLETLTRSHIGQPLPLALDGETLAAPTLREAIAGGVVTITGAYSLSEAEALAKRISGKDPLPDEFEE